MINENYSQLENIFREDIKNADNSAKVIYDKTIECIKELEDYASPIGLRIYQGKKENLAYPEIQLGWIQLKETEENRYFLLLSKKGAELIDRLREIRGQFSIKESRENLKKMLDDSKKIPLENLQG